jgi:hypothetical protein
LQEDVKENNLRCYCNPFSADRIILEVVLETVNLKQIKPSQYIRMNSCSYISEISAVACGLDAFFAIWLSN